MTPEIVTVGWLTVDDIVLTDGTCRQGVRGGGALYSAVGAHLWHASVGIHSTAGAPHFEETRRLVERRGIDASGISRTDGNGLELWLLHESPVHKQQIPKLSSSRALDLDRERGALPTGWQTARGYHIAPQGPASGIENVRRLAALPSEPVVTMDILSDGFIDASAYRDLAFLSGLAAFLPSEAEVARIWNPPDLTEWLTATARAHGRPLVVKRGEEGALVADATGRRARVPAFPAAVVDTTGAGDAFCGGFLAGLVAGRGLVTAAAMGTVSASYVIEASGALATPEPAAEERDDRLRRVLAGVVRFDP